MNRSGDSMFNRLMKGLIRTLSVAGVFTALLIVLGSCDEAESVNTPADSPNATALPQTATGAQTPPDLSGCTHLELQYHPNALEFFFLDESPSVLSQTEIEFVRTFDTFVIEDPAWIKAIAFEIAAGHHIQPMSSLISEPPVTVSYLHDNECTSELIEYGHIVTTESGNWFEYDSRIESTEIEPPQLEPLVLRSRCAENLRDLALYLAMYVSEKKVAPPHDRWSDALLSIALPGPEVVAGDLVCPSAAVGRSHYALNSAWEPNSPPGTVLLFEAEAGWNQVGGPELFTFDNHDPKGGCIVVWAHEHRDLIGDVALIGTNRQGEGVVDAEESEFEEATVLFVRTREELNALHWK